MIPNPSFELNSSIPSIPGEIYLCTGWGNVNGGIGWPYGSPDYMHDNGGWTVNIPSTNFGFVNAYDGDAIMGLIMFGTAQGTDFREYMTVQLTSPMVVGSTYTLSFNLTNGESNIYSGSSCNHIGIQFSNGPLSQIDHEPIGGIPQIEIAGEVWTNVWQNYTFNYVADAAYNYLTVGNFYNNSSTNSTIQEPNADFPNAAYYFIDEMELSIYYPPIQIQGDTIICAGDSSVITGWDDPNNSYAWADQLAPNTIISTDSSITVYPLVNTTYLLYGSVDTLSISVNIEFPPVFDLGNDTALCLSDTLILNATNPFSAYLWQDGSTDSTFLVSIDGQYSVDVTNNCGVTTDDIDVIFEIMPMLNLGSDTVFCQSVELILDASTPYCSYLWQDLSTENIYNVNQPGTYSLELTHSCGTITDTINISLDFTPFINLGNDTILCIGEILILDAAYPFSTYLWQDNSTTPTLSVTSLGTYSVNVTNHCGTTNDSIKVIYESLPSIFFGEDTTFCDSDEIILDATSPGCSFVWQDLSTAPFFEVNQSGTYTVELTNTCGSVSDTIELVLEICGGELEMPNIFTPNNDGANDEFIPVKMNDIISTHLVVLNRWGEVVFENDDVSIGWNGKISGENCSEGVYYYLVNYVDINDEKGKIHGFVTVVR